MGVYVGIQHIDYLHDAKLHMTDLSVYLVLSCPLSVVAGRISFLFGLHGACFSVDTACSASLVALKQAQAAVVANQEPAMISGVELILSQMTNLSIQRAGMLSPEARCKTLDASADGYVRAEAVCATTVRPAGLGVEEAPLAVLGCATNQDGRSSSLTAPHGPSQQAVIQECLRNGGVQPEEVSGLQMHGTGTPLGDPIEMGAIAHVLVQGHAREAPLSLSAAKANLGHGEAAAGTLGMLQAAACVTAAATAPNPHLRDLNPFVSNLLEGCAKVRPSRMATPIVPDAGTLAEGISGFGFQGTNAHVGIGQYPGRQTGLEALTERVWESERFWCTSLVTRTVSVARAAEAGFSFCTRLLASDMAFLRDHVVEGRGIFPGAAFLEVAATCTLSGSAPVNPQKRSFEKYGSINFAVIASALPLVDSKIFVQTELKHNGSMSISSRGVDESTYHCYCSARQVAAEKASRGSGSGVSNSLSPPARSGLQPRGAPKAAACRIAAPGTTGFALGPSVLDNLFQVENGRSPSSVMPVEAAGVGQKSAAFVPASVEVFRISSFEGNTHTDLAGGSFSVEKGPTRSITSFKLRRLSEEEVCETVGLVAKRISGSSDSARPQPSERQQAVYDIRWNAAYPVKPFGPARPKLATCVGEQRSSERDFLNMAAAFQRTCKSSISGGRTVRLHTFRVRLCEAPSASGAEKNVSGAMAKALLKAVNLNFGGDWEESGGCAGSARGRAVQSLHLMPARSGDQRGEPNSACVSASSVFLPSLVPTRATYQDCIQDYYLSPGSRGSLEGLEVVPLQVQARGTAGPVFKVTIRAVGLNFRDVLNVLGMYPGDPGPPGGDCAGIVSSLADCQDGDGFEIGEAVYGIVSGLSLIHI